jgi:hypothetical protein
MIYNTWGDVGERTINKSQPGTLRQIHPLPTRQPPFHFLNNTIPNRGGLIRSTQRQTQISHRQRSNPTSKKISQPFDILYSTEAVAQYFIFLDSAPILV